MIEPNSYDDPKLKELINILIEWINDELAGYRIIVKDIEEDLYDGQVLQKLLGEFKLFVVVVYLLSFQSMLYNHRFVSINSLFGVVFEPLYHICL